ncbi:hypothetical protein QMA09_07735 [Planococcus sp. APC 3906]|nr:hypothetical protein [Planococcus sp. APC 3906]MDN3450078.1 hypothetical protein [Planococcus sp. APC 3906]
MAANAAFFDDFFYMALIRYPITFFVLTIAFRFLICLVASTQEDEE